MPKIKVKKRKGGALAYIEHKGAYGSIPFDDYYKELYDWAKAKKARPGFKPFVVYITDPNNTPESEWVTQVAIPVGITAEPAGKVQVRELPDMEIAILKHAATAEEYGNSYAEIGKWIEENGYDVTHPPMEVYTKKPKVKDGKTIIFSDIQFPVKKK